jgi:hypothetical protein
MVSEGSEHSASYPSRSLLSSHLESYLVFSPSLQVPLFWKNFRPLLLVPFLISYCSQLADLKSNSSHLLSSIASWLSVFFYCAFEPRRKRRLGSKVEVIGRIRQTEPQTEDRRNHDNVLEEREREQTANFLNFFAKENHTLKQTLSADWKTKCFCFLQR